MKPVVPILLAFILFMNFLIVIRVFKLDEKIHNGFRETEYSAAIAGEFISSNDPNELLSKLQMKNVKITNNGNLYKITGDIMLSYMKTVGNSKGWQFFYRKAGYLLNRPLPSKW